MYDNLKKKYGQNFLIDKNILNKIEKLINKANLNILEIGPGSGLLTERIIAKKPLKLTTIEIDKELIEYLKKKFINHSNLEIINLDFLKYDMNFEFDLIISNLPYNISSQILVKIVSSTYRPKNMIFMFQKEFAKKFFEKKLNSLNSLVNIFYNCKKEFYVSKNSFKPIPKVESTVVSFEIIKNPLLQNIELENFIKFKRKIFSKKRKQLKSILKSNYNLKKLDYLNNRAEDLNLNQLIKIFRND